MAEWSSDGEAVSSGSPKSVVLTEEPPGRK